MSTLFDKLLGIFRNRSKASSVVSSSVPLTPEKIRERIHPRPVMHQPLSALSPIESAGVVVDQPAPPLPDPEFVIAALADRGEQRRIYETPVGGPSAAVASAERIDIFAPATAIAPDPPSIFAEEITWAENADEPKTVEEPSVKRSPTQTPTGAQPTDEILPEFQASMPLQFGREEPATVGAGPDILTILRLDKGEPVRACLDSPPLEAKPKEVLPSVPLESKIETLASITTSGSEPPLIAGGHAVSDEESDGADEKLAPIAWKGRTVGEVMLEGECSVRLSNCIAANQDFFSDWTIGEASAHRSKFAAVLMHVRNLGRKTANEALDILEAFALDPRIRDEENVEQDKPAPVDPLSAFDPARLDAPLREVLECRPISMRLANLLVTGALDDLTVRHFFLQQDKVRTRMLGCKNAGKKTVTEAFELLAAHVEALGQPSCRSICAQAEDSPPEGLTTREWIEQQMAALPPNRVEVLHDRYGLNGQRPKTLQEIAQRVHVTRERVRQVEAGALRRLRRDRRSRAAFSHYLTEKRDLEWATLVGAGSAISEDEISERFRKLDPWFLLAIDIVFENGRDGYLNENAHKTTAGWFRSSDEAEGRRKLDQHLDGILRTYQTPMPLDTLAEFAPSAEVPAVGEGSDWAVYDGYLFTGYLGPKARRTMHMHAVARRIAQSGIFDIGTLIVQYRSEFPEDECSSRMFEMQANEAPHLFAPLFDGIWLCLDHNSRKFDRLPAPPFERRRVEETHFAEESLGDRLIKQLSQFGPQRAIDLRRTIIDSTQNSFSESSIGAVLISNPCFRRVAPGIFGLYTGASHVPASIDAHLLQDRHCRAYCHARHAGAPQDYYPLWNAVYEMRLAVWAQRHAPNDLYRSLMSVIDPESWPAETDTIANFQALRSRDGRWEIGAARRLPLGHRFLDSSQFLSTLTHLVVFGWLSWVGVNRATGSKSDNHDAADVLAFFVMTGLLEPEADWQDTHRPTDLAQRLYLEARWERHLHGDTLSGADGVFGRLRSTLYDTPPTAPRGWVDLEEFRTAMPAWLSEEIWMGKAYGGGQTRQPGINAEESFESDDWDAVFGG